MKMRVMWIDDLFKSHSDIIGYAEQLGIDIIGFESSEEGLEELGKNAFLYHAVILDAKVKANRNSDDTNLKGLRSSRDWIVEYNAGGNYLPYFIFTGQPDYADSEMFKESFGDFYVKGRDNEKLFTDLIDRVNRKSSFLVERMHKQALDACSKYLGQEMKRDLVAILESTVSGSFSDFEKYYTSLRKMVEVIFRQANQYGLLHDKCLADGKVNLVESSRFMAGEKTKYLGVYSAVSHFPGLIAHHVQSIIFITSAASHTAGEREQGTYNLAEYHATLRTPYLLYSLTYAFLDVLIWFDFYVSKNSDMELNRSYWKTLDVDLSEAFEGVLEQDERNNFHVGDVLVKFKYAENNLTLGEIVRVEKTVLNTDERTNQFYPTVAIRVV